jgi:hypothetical protein
MEPLEVETTQVALEQTGVTSAVGPDQDTLRRWHRVYNLLREIAARPLPEPEGEPEKVQAAALRDLPKRTQRECAL